LTLLLRSNAEFLDEAVILQDMKTFSEWKKAEGIEDTDLDFIREKKVRIQHNWFMREIVSPL
jgi:hypothetical protein